MPVHDFSVIREVEIRKLRDGSSALTTDEVIEELPVALVYNGISHAVMMATPCDLEDFAYGFSLSEGLIDRAQDLRVLELIERQEGVVIELAMPDHCMQRLTLKQRNLLGASGCGVCGAQALEQLQSQPQAVSSGAVCTLAEIKRGLLKLQLAQPLNQRAGGVHAAAWISQADIVVREDVGRHNALDKLIGHHARVGRAPGILVLSSRASFELIQKAASADIQIVIAISAPTAQAIRTAVSCGITLVAFARDDQMNIYSHPERIVAQAA